MKTIIKTKHLIERFIERAEGITEAEAKAKYRAMSTKQHDKIFTMLLKAIKRSTEKHVRIDPIKGEESSVIIVTNYKKKTQTFCVSLGQCTKVANDIIGKTVLSEYMMTKNILKYGGRNVESIEFHDAACNALSI